MDVSFIRARDGRAKRDALREGEATIPPQPLDGADLLDGLRAHKASAQMTRSDVEDGAYLLELLHTWPVVGEVVLLNLLDDVVRLGHEEPLVPKRNGVNIDLSI